MLQPIQGQIWLRHFGEKDIVVDGIFGKLSEAATVRVLRAHNMKMHQWGDPLTALTQFVMKKVGGLTVGRVDGLRGTKTNRAWKHWVQGTWRNVLMAEQEIDQKPVEDPSQRWPKQSEMHKFYGEAGTGLVTITMPYPLRFSWDLNAKQTTVRCHKHVADSLLRVHNSIYEAYGYQRLQTLRIDIFGGCFNLRPMRGSRALSTHAYGAAWDTDPVKNALHANGTQANLNKPVYADYWKAWEDEGWLSLGRARDFDWMHTQAARLG